MLGSIRERRLFFFFFGGGGVTRHFLLIYILPSGLWGMTIASGVLGIFLTATAH